MPTAGYPRSARWGMKLSFPATHGEDLMLPGPFMDYATSQEQVPSGVATPAPGSQGHPASLLQPPVPFRLLQLS